MPDCSAEEGDRAGRGNGSRQVKDRSETGREDRREVGIVRYVGAQDNVGRLVAEPGWNSPVRDIAPVQRSHDHRTRV